MGRISFVPPIFFPAAVCGQSIQDAAERATHAPSYSRVAIWKMVDPCQFMRLPRLWVEVGWGCLVVAQWLLGRNAFVYQRHFVEWQRVGVVWGATQTDCSNQRTFSRLGQQRLSILAQEVGFALFVVFGGVRSVKFCPSLESQELGHQADDPQHMVSGSTVSCHPPKHQTLNLAFSNRHCPPETFNEHQHLIFDSTASPSQTAPVVGP